jgi:hypothetical protein
MQQHQRALVERRLRQVAIVVAHETGAALPPVRGVPGRAGTDLEAEQCRGDGVCALVDREPSASEPLVGDASFRSRSEVGGPRRSVGRVRPQASPFPSRARVNKNGLSPILEENRSRFNSPNPGLERLAAGDDRPTASGRVAPSTLQRRPRCERSVSRSSSLPLPLIDLHEGAPYGGREYSNCLLTASPLARRVQPS